MAKRTPLVVFEEGVTLPDDFEPPSTRDVILHIFKDHNLVLDELNVVFTDDKFLQNLHRDYLNDPEKTDVITFDLSDEGSDISGEIYISVDRARAQAKEYNTTVLDEIRRYIIHGVLHLCGLSDKSEADRSEMRACEDKYLALFREEN